MKYSCLLFLFTFLTLCERVIGQDLTKTQRTYFVLGTLGDYMGRNLDPRDKNLLDRYYANEGALVNLTDSLLKIDYSQADYKVDRYTNAAGGPLSYKIFSDTLFKQFNAFYNFVPGTSRTTENEPILLGKLKDDLFKTDDERLAFLAGAFARFGRVDKGNYEMNIANSVSKAKVCNELLAYFSCSPNYQIITSNIPNAHLISFRPSPRVAAYLEKYIPLQKAIYDTLLKVLNITLPNK